MNHAPIVVPDETVAPAPVAKREPTEAEAWAEKFARADGGTGRRRVVRAYKRHQAKKVVVANRRRFRQHVSDRMTASTIGQQLRILAGEFGTDAQRARIEAEYREIARDQEQDFDSMVAQMRVQLGLDELVTAE